MLELDQLQVDGYNYETAQPILAECPRLTALAQVPDWRARATDERASVRSYLDGLARMEEQLTRARDEATAAHAARSWFFRTFRSDPARRKLKEAETGLTAARTNAAAWIAALDRTIALTPTTVADRAAILAELRNLKKEAARKKRLVNQEMRDVRAQAQRESASAAFWPSAKIRHGAAVAIRQNKQRALRPHQEARAQIEEQTDFLDATINRLERLK